MTPTDEQPGAVRQFTKPIQRCRVAIVGSGPAGLACATRLRELGVDGVLVLERESQAGGVPRHCAHSPYGWRERGRPMFGPAYARWLVGRAIAAGVQLRVAHSVVSIEPGGVLLMSCDAGTYRIQAERVVLATGVRESSRASQMVGGTRPLGVMNTGALQGLVYLQGHRPFQQPVIVGSELVAFSALLTCRHAGMHPVAMLEPGQHAVAGKWATALPTLLRVPYRGQTQVVAIHGQHTVTGVTLEYRAHKRMQLACDGVVFSGRFRPDVVLARAAGLTLDASTAGPQIDQYGRSSDRLVFVAGNLRRPVETAGWCWQEGHQVAMHLAADLCGDLPPALERVVPVKLDDPVLRYVSPQVLVPGAPGSPAASGDHDGVLQLRVSRAVQGRLLVRSAGRVIWQKRVRARPEQRVLVPMSELQARDAERPLRLSFRHTRG